MKKLILATFLWALLAACSTSGSKEVIYEKGVKKCTRPVNYEIIHKPALDLKVDEIFRLSLSDEEKLERVGALSQDVQDIDAQLFRLCEAYANGAMDEATYNKKYDLILRWKEIKSISVKDSPVSLGEIKNNINTQINVNSPNSSQIINEARKINRNFKIQEKNENGYYLTKAILTQTKGIWDPGEKFIIEVSLSEPFIEYDIDGFPGIMLAVRKVINKERTFLHFETTTAPLKDKPIILEFKSEKPNKIIKIAAQPLADMAQ